MDIPSNYNAIVEDVANKILKYGEKTRVPAPTIIKGNHYSGVELICLEIYKKVEKQASKYFHLKKLNLRLTDTNVASEIQGELNLREKGDKKGTIFFIDGIDRLLNSSSKTINKNAKMGRAATASETIEEAHKLRKILLENANRISIISSSGQFTSFMENPDLPFYKFFNEIKLNPLSPEDTAKYFFLLLKKNYKIDSKSDPILDLGGIGYDWTYKISGGNWLLIQQINQIINDTNIYKSKSNFKTGEILNEIFIRLQPILMMEMESLSRDERRFIESAFSLGIRFNTREMNLNISNPSLLAKRLVSKNILTKTTNLAGSYNFNHIALRTVLRYYNQFDLRDVFSDNPVQTKMLHLKS